MRKIRLRSLVTKAVACPWFKDSGENESKFNPFPLQNLSWDHEFVGCFAEFAEPEVLLELAGVHRLP